MKIERRLLGIDLCRGIAAYAVILVHCGDETWGIPVDPLAAEFRHFFYFAVPFFLATSFYFTTCKPKINVSQQFWLSRIERTLIPYIVWSLLYLIFKIIIFSATNQTETIKSLLQDPLAIVFFGGISYHLYFLPLLFTGYFVLFLGKILKTRDINIKWLVALSIMSIVLYHLMLVSNNSFILGSNIAFPEILELFSAQTTNYAVARLIMVELAWILRCLPYLLVAMCINYWFANISNRIINKKTTIVLLLIAFIVANVIRKNFFSEALIEIFVAYSLLLFAIAVSGKIKEHILIINLGACSFGIYLIHPLVKSFVEMIIAQILPTLTEQVSILSMLVYSGLTFVFSWWIIAQLNRQKLIAKYMFGV
jgi:peptidoglycan/LPS O-acetylase OafA/YrhL